MKREVVILSVDDTYKNSIKNSLDNINEGAPYYKDRPFYVELDYSDKYRIFVPLRSNCTLRKYSIPLFNDKNRKNHGLDCSKMLIMNTEEAKKYSKAKTDINNDVYNDICIKKKQIQHKINNTLQDYKVILKKRRNQLYLTKEETALYKQSTLINYQNFVYNYIPMSIDDTDDTDDKKDVVKAENKKDNSDVIEEKETVNFFMNDKEIKENINAEKSQKDNEQNKTIISVDERKE